MRPPLVEDLLFTWLGLVMVRDPGAERAAEAFFDELIIVDLHDGCSYEPLPLES